MRNDLEAPKTQATNPLMSGRSEARPKPLPEKSQELARRRHEARLRQSAQEERADTRGTNLVSSCGRIRFTLAACGHSLLATRTQFDGSGKLVQQLAFADAPTFDRWCDAEPLRFDDPALFQRLRRRGHEVLHADR